MLNDGEDHSDLCIGIDLGTTNSVLATINLKANGNIISRVVDIPRAADMYSSSGFVIKNLPTLPSCVYYNAEKNFAPVVGDFAKSRYSLKPHLVAKSVKNQMGNENFEGLSEDVPDKTPAEISARILEHMLKQTAKIYRQSKIDDAVITVPAGFNDVMRQATLKAAEIAGIKIYNADGSPRQILLNESQAVIYDFINQVHNGEFPAQVLDLSSEKIVMVFDLGGGSLNVTLHKISYRQDELLNVEDLATNRYTLLGGDDFDLALAEEMFLRYLKKYAQYPSIVSKIKREEKIVITQLLSYAEELKIRISIDKGNSFEDEKYLVGGNIDATGYAYDDSFTTQELENVWKKFMGENFSFDDYKNFEEVSQNYYTANIISPVLEVLKEYADKSGNENIKIDAVLMSGGMSNFYMVVNRLEKFFGFAPVVMPEPELSVARGAAVYHYFLHKYNEKFNVETTTTHIDDKIFSDIDTETTTFKIDDKISFDVSAETTTFKIDYNKIPSDDVTADKKDFTFMQLMSELLKIHSSKNKTLKSKIDNIAAAMCHIGNIYYEGRGDVEQDFPTAARWYERADSLGNADASYKVAKMYYEGKGVEQDFDKARRLFEKSAKLENPNSMYFLGLIYKNGQCVNQNLEKAFEFFEKAANLNNNDAIHELGMMYYNGEGVEKNLNKAAIWLEQSKKFSDSEAAFNIGKFFDAENFPKHARKWYEKAAEFGNVEAMYKVALIYHEGRGVYQSSRFAADWYKKAAELGHAESMFQIGKMFYEGDGLNINREMAFHWYKKSAELGNPKAMCNLGGFYVEEADYTKAVEWFEKAVEQSDDEIIDKPLNNLAQMYFLGMGVEKDFNKAFELFEKAANLGNEDAKNKLGIMYYEGKGVEKNFEKAAELGNKDAMYKLGEMYFHGDGVEKDIEKATQWLKKSGKSIDGKLAYNIGEFYFEQKNFREAVEWYEKADKNSDALYKLGMMYYNDNNSFGVYQNLRRAAEYFERAADFGNVDAMYHLAEMYYKGMGVTTNWKLALTFCQKAIDKGSDAAAKLLETIETEKIIQIAEDYFNQKNFDKAFEWYDKAAKRGNKNAIKNLAAMYENGQGVKQNLEKAAELYLEVADESNPDEAFKIYKKAAGIGNVKAMCKLADMYRDEHDFKSAVEWYEKAADLDNAEAIYNLGNMYYGGQGVRQNFEKAVELYEKAADKNYNAAIESLLYADADIFEKLVEKYRAQKDFEKVVKWYEKAADSGNATAMYNLAEMYDKGAGVEKDFERAVEWYEKAANTGHEDALNIFFSFDANNFVKIADKYRDENFDKAVEWYQRAADLDDAEAMYNLAKMYAEKDFEKAVEWYEKAAAAGYEDAINAVVDFGAENFAKIADKYFDEKNFVKAVKFYEKAAELDDINSMYKLAEIYEKGQGTDKNFEKAFTWYRKATELSRRN